MGMLLAMTMAKQKEEESSAPVEKEPEVAVEEIKEPVKAKKPVTRKPRQSKSK